MQRADSLEKNLMLGKTESRRKGRQRTRWLDGITDSTDMRFEQALENGKGQGTLVCSSPWVPKELDMTEKVNNKYNKSILRIPAFHCRVFKNVHSRVKI